MGIVRNPTGGIALCGADLSPIQFAGFVAVRLLIHLRGGGQDDLQSGLLGCLVWLCLKAIAYAGLCKLRCHH